MTGSILNSGMKNFQLFCFICGFLVHLDCKCVKVYDYLDGIAPKPYGAWMRANPRTSQSNNGEKWFRLVPVATRGGMGTGYQAHQTS